MTSLKEPQSSSSNSAPADSASSQANPPITQSTFVNGKSYARIVVAESDDNENVGAGSTSKSEAQKPEVTNKKITKGHQQENGSETSPNLPKHHRSSRSPYSQSQGRFYSHSSGNRAGAAKKIPFQNQNINSQPLPHQTQPEPDNATTTRLSTNLQNESPDDFEVVIRKSRANGIGNHHHGQGPKFRKGRADFYSSSNPNGNTKPKDYDIRRHGNGGPSRRPGPLHQDHHVNSKPDSILVQSNTTNNNLAPITVRKPESIENGGNIRLEECGECQDKGIENQNETNSCSCSSNSTASCSDKDEFTASNANVVATKTEYVVAPPPKVNPWLKSKSIKTAISTNTKDGISSSMNTVNSQKLSQKKPDIPSTTRDNAEVECNTNKNNNNSSNTTNTQSNGPSSSNSYAKQVASSGKLPGSGSQFGKNQARSSSFEGI